jgi:D-arabinose 1-dehydrogenase-like Zn-dependent alcohol dehydrogenase
MLRQEAEMKIPHPNFQREVPIMKKGDRLVIVGMGGVGGPAAMLAKRLMPEVDVTVIREEERFIVR